MILKNVLSQGYPFVEAIASALAICDEFLVSDGYSSDGTYEVIREIAKANSKVKLHQDVWPEARNFSSVLRTVSNWVRRRAQGEYLLYLQANEVIHEDCVDYIRALPEIMPDYATFAFPFIQLLSTFIFREEFRIRFAKNLDWIEAVDDAWSLGVQRSFVFKVLIQNPHRLPRYLGAGIRMTYANTGNAQYSRIVCLPAPVFRYYSLFPLNFVQKMRNHMRSFTEYDWKSIERFLQKHADADLSSVDANMFWNEAIQALTEFTNQFEKLPKKSRPNPIIRKENHPQLMKCLIDNPSVSEYHVRTSLLDRITGL
jgi:glycosyltransferase involved in cell wall biosynthesis